MEEQQNSIDEIFRQSLGDYREAPPAAAWDRISSRLDGKDDTIRPGFFMRWRWMFMTCIFLTGCTALLVAKYYNGNPKNHDEKSLTVAHPKNQPNSSNNTSTQNQTSASSQNSTNPITSATSAGNPDKGLSAGKPPYASNQTTVQSRNKIASRMSDVGVVPGGGDGVRNDEAATNSEPSMNEPMTVASPSNMRDTYISFAQQKNVSRSQEQYPSTASLNPTSKRKTTTPATTTSPAQQYASNTPVTIPASVVLRAATSNNSGNNSAKIITIVTKTDNAPVAKSESGNKEPGMPAILAAGGHPKTSLRNEQDASPEPRPIVPVATISSKKETATQTGTDKIGQAPTASASVTGHRRRTAKAGATKMARATSAKKDNGIHEDDKLTPSSIAPAMAMNKAAQPLRNGAAKKTADDAAQLLLASAAPQKADTPRKTASQRRIEEAARFREERRKADMAADTTDKPDTSDEERDPYLSSDTYRRTLPISLAALAGYEIGTSDVMRGRFNLGMRLMWHVNSKLAIGLQPTVRIGSVSSTNLGQGGTYQRSTISVDSFTTLDYSPTLLGDKDTIHNYVIRETYDSIIVTGTHVKGTMYEVELPLIISYKLPHNWRIYAGPSLNFGGRLPSISTPDQQIFSIVRKDSIAQSVKKPVSEFVNYFGTTSSLEKYSNYQAPALDDPASLRLGYLIGFTYKWKRGVFDASIHQQFSGYGDVHPDLKKIYSTPYINLNIGYYLIPPRKKITRIAED